MAKMIRLVLAVSAETLAETIETLQGMESVSTVALIKSGDDITSGTIDTAADDDTEIDRKVRRANARQPRNGQTTTTRRGFGGRPKLYTPAATQAQITKALAALDGKSLTALMLKTIASKKTIDKSALRAVATKHGFNAESVDNVVWRQQKDGLVKSIEK